MKKILSILLSTTLLLSSVSISMPTNYVMASDIDTESILSEQLDMPIVSIDTLNNSINSKETYTDAKITIWNDDGTLDTDESDISIRLRGNMTLNLAKKSYRFKFTQKSNPLDLGEGSAKSWNLVANYCDTSLLRNMTAYHLGDIMDNMPYTPNSRSVEVYVNGSYQGVYLLTEAVNVAKSRINITEKADLIEDNGYLIEMSRYAEENPFTIESYQYEVKSDVSTDSDIAQQQIDYISDYTEKAFNALKNGNREEVEKYIDIDSLVDNCIANEICKNVDAGWDSYYMSKDAGGKLTFNPMWDYDLALGNNTEAKGIEDPTGMGIYDISDSCSNSNPWICYAFRCDWFRELLVQRWDEKVAEIETLPEFVTSEAEKNKLSYERNFTKWSVLGKTVYNEPESFAEFTTHTAHAENLANWLNDRIEWLDTYYHSDDFSDGIFLDENNKPFQTNNAIAMSSLMFWGGSGEIDTDSPGFTAQATTSSWGGQALATGLILKKDTKYKLSFNYTAPDTATINYRIQQNHDYYSSYMSGSVSPDSTQHFETEITMSAEDSNCALVLEFKGSGTVKVENLSLVTVENDTIMGDVNADGTFNVSDVVLMQKWVLSISDAKLDDWESGDMNGDKILNVFDLCMMKQKLM